MIYGILALGLVLRLISLNQSFWLDEAAQAMIASQPFSHINWAADFSPPLSYGLTHIWLQITAFLGTRADWFIRIPNVVVGITTIYIFYLLLKDMFNRKIALLGSLMLAVSPFHIYYSQDLRMYAVLSLLILLSWYSLWKKNKWLLGISTTLAVFTHYFAFVSIAAQIVYIFIFDRKYVQKIFMIFAFSVAPFFVWLPTFLKQVKTAQHLVTVWPHWSDVSNTEFLKLPGLILAKFTVGMISPENRIFYAAVVFAMGIIFLLSIGTVLRAYILKPTQNDLRHKGLFLLSFFVIPLALVWLAGLWIPAASPWRMQFVLPAFYGIIAVGLYTLLQAKIRYRILAMILISIMLIQNLYFAGSYLLVEAYHRENWKGAVAYTDQYIQQATQSQEEALVLAEFDQPWATMEWYTQYPNYYIGAATDRDITKETVAAKLDPIVLHTDTFILYTYLFEVSDPERLVEEYIHDKGYILSQEKDFRGVGIIKIFTRDKAFAAS